MTLSFAIALFVCIVGCVLYVVSAAGSKVNEIGRLMFACGLLATLLRFAGEAALTIR